MTSRPARVARHRRHTVGALLHRAHRWMGVAVCLFIVFLVFTGWALNHTAELGLARLSVQVPWISSWYGLRGEVPTMGYTASGRWLIAGEATALLDGKPIDVKLDTLIGMSAAAGLIAVASRNELLLLDTQGRVLERVLATQLPMGPITRIGNATNVIVAQGNGSYASEDGVKWTPYAGDVIWSARQALPPDQQVFAKKLAPGISLERIMQDLHSGRVLGRYGPYLVDAVGLIFLLLAASGLWMFFRHRRR